ncbi:androglobin isoform X1 [Ornithorhynchus anatinus]|uniref:Androglobin n=1 Tax=Ornithorhynchus anatinus TaxID=9258 RepID=A0A6I8P3R3_ORNAN|nr:androglobin isoform X1 [Ornithorhynchus anatinus]
MSSKQTKKKEVHRINSAQNKETFSMGNIQGGLGESRKGKFPIWPEWNEADINAEKWDGGKGIKEKEKAGKSPIIHFFDDPEGKIELPPSLKVFSWKRPQEFLTKVPVVVKNENRFNLFSANEHLICSELMRWIISELCAVWKIYNGNILNSEFKGNGADLPPLFWKPWEHIYALCKAVKGHMPLFNAYGKYVVKLYWMGCWRKITVDDTLPFDEEDNLLLPATTCEIELWPMILTKAIIKLANTDIHVAGKREVTEFTVLHAFTGWLPEVIPLRQGYLDKVWNFLREKLPEFKLPEDITSENKMTVPDAKAKDAKLEVKSENVLMNKAPEKMDKSGKEKLDTKELGKKKSKDGEKEKYKLSIHGSRPSSDVQYSLQSISECSSSLPGLQLPHMLQTVVYAVYIPLHLFEKIFKLGQMADSAEKLREYGLSHIFSHPVLVTRTRSCPITAPPKPQPVPPWKLIRPKKETLVTDEAQVQIIKKPDQFVEISSPFLNFRIHSIPIPSKTCVEKSVIKKGLLPRSGLPSVTESDESIMDNLIDPNQTGRVLSGQNGSQAYLTPQDGLTKEEFTENINNDLLQLSETTDFYLQPGPIKEKSQEEIELENIPVSKEIWLDFEDFCTCFQNLYVFHKPNSYCYSFQKADFKSTDDRVFYYLYVDSLKPIEILVSFSALVRWGEAGASSKENSGLAAGMLTAKKFSWKSLAPGDLVLKIHTNATKASIIHLPIGRHALLFTASASVGHHIHLCSMAPFAFGEEDSIMPHFEKESHQFIEQATVILKAVGSVITNFHKNRKLSEMLKNLELTHCPTHLQNKELTAQHYKIFNICLWHLMKKVFGNKAPPNFKFAFRTLTLDLNATETTFEDDASLEWADTKYFSTWNDKISSLEEKAAVKLQACWRGSYIRKLMRARKPDTKENASVSDTLQKLWFLMDLNLEVHAVSLLRMMFKTNCKSFEQYPCYQDEITKTVFADYTGTYPDQAPNSWFVVFRETFHVAHSMLVVPKVYTTLPACMLHVVNNDTMEEIPRVFQKVVPHVYTRNKKGYTFMAEAHTGDLHVAAGKWKLRLIGSYSPLPHLSRETVNNSYSIKEIKDYYIPNEKQILFRYSVKVAAANAATVQVYTSKPDVFIKLQVLVNEEEVASTVGKGHAVIPMFNFRSNEKILSCQSSRQQFVGHSNLKKEQDSLSMKKKTAGAQRTNKMVSRPGSVVESHTNLEEDSVLLPTLDENGAVQPLIYKYIIQTLVLNNSWPLTESQLTFVQALKDLDKSEMRVPAEKHEESVISGIVDFPSSTEGTKSAVSSKTTRKTKDKASEKVDKEKTVKEKAVSRPDSQIHQRDPNKAHWILRLVNEQNEADTLEVKKDTERADEIRAMKQAWESAEPGRSVKAQQARRQFINFCSKEVAAESTVEPQSLGTTTGLRERVSSTGIALKPPTPTAIDTHRKEWKPLDLTPYIRQTTSKPILRTESLIQQQALQKAAEIRQFRQYRDKVLEQREYEQAARSELKEKVLEMYEDLQESLDEARARVFTARESYRSKLLEAELKKQEVLAAEEAALQAEQERKSPDAQRKKQGKGSGKKK